MSDEQKTEQTASNVGQKIASTEISIPLNIPITERQVAGGPSQTNENTESSDQISGADKQSHSPTDNQTHDTLPPASDASQPTSSEKPEPQSPENSEPSSNPMPTDTSKADSPTATEPPATEQPTSNASGKAEAAAEELSSLSDELSDSSSGSDSDSKGGLAEVLQNIEPITIKATPGDTKAATNPAIKLFVGIGAAVSLIGLVCVFVVSTIAGISLVGLGVLIIAGGVLSPKPGK
jgi:hypothetical protein